MYIYILGEDKPESSLFCHDFIKETPVVGSIYKNLSTYIRLRNWRAAKFQNYYQRFQSLHIDNNCDKVLIIACEFKSDKGGVSYWVENLASKIKKDSEDHDPVIHYLEDIPNDFYSFSTLNDHLKRGGSREALSSDEIFIDNLLTIFDNYFSDNFKELSGLRHSPPPEITRFKDYPLVLKPSIERSKLKGPKVVSLKEFSQEHGLGDSSSLTSAGVPLTGAGFSCELGQGEALDHVLEDDASNSSKHVYESFDENDQLGESSPLSGGARSSRSSRTCFNFKELCCKFSILNCFKADSEA